MLSKILVSWLIAQSCGQSNTGKKAFDALEARIAASSTIKVVVSGAIDGEVTQATLDATLYIGTINKARYDIALSGTKLKGITRKLQLISNGTKLNTRSSHSIDLSHAVDDPFWKELFKGESPEKIEVRDTPVWLNDSLKLSCARMGPIVLLGLANSLQTEIKKHSSVDMFSEISTDTIEGRATKLISFRLGGDMLTKLWLDAKTQLPVKYESNLGESRLVFSFREFVLDEKVDAELFKLPK